MNATFFISPLTRLTPQFTMEEEAISSSLLTALTPVIRRSLFSQRYFVQLRLSQAGTIFSGRHHRPFSSFVSAS